MQSYLSMPRARATLQSDFPYNISARCMLTRMGNRINETYAGRHYKCILQHPNYFLNAYKYNYRNPVSAGMCTNVEYYPYSTLPSIMGLSNIPFPMAEDTTWNSDPAGTLAWLSTLTSSQVEVHFILCLEKAV